MNFICPSGSSEEARCLSTLGGAPGLLVPCRGVCLCIHITVLYLGIELKCLPAHLCVVLSLGWYLRQVKGLLLEECLRGEGVSPRPVMF